ncbi:addiction module protein [Microbacterium sp. NPDC003461]
MVTPGLKATVDRLTPDERRDLLHYLEQTVDDQFELTREQIAELERRDSELTDGRADSVGIDEFMRQARARIR